MEGDEQMMWYNIAMVLGIPSVMFMLYGYLFKRIKQSSTESEATKRGIQALLRAIMISEYNKAKDRGFAPIYAKDSFENMWQNYHSLGANGVMDNIHEAYMQMSDRADDTD